MSPAASAQRTERVDVTSDDGAALGTVSVSVHRPARSKAAAVISHGAGGTMATPSIVRLAERLADGGVTAVRFNFLYAERGKKAPDRQPALLSAWRSVADWVRRDLAPKRLFLSGRSMGGRMASYLAAEGYACDGLFFLAYPLHPPGKPEKLRSEHLADVGAPMLFITGTRDAFARLDLLEPVVKRTRSVLHLLEGADHGFKVPKKYGRSAEDVDAEVAGVVLDFISKS